MQHVDLRAEPSFGTLLCHSPPQCNTHMKRGLMPRIQNLRGMVPYT
jgi:hypothetical protein